MHILICSLSPIVDHRFLTTLGDTMRLHTIPRRAPILGAALMLVAACLAPAAAFAHGGGLDRNGCHTNHKTGDYHCHRKP